MIYRNYPRVKKKLIEEVHALATLLLFDFFFFFQKTGYIYIYASQISIFYPAGILCPNNDF